MDYSGQVQALHIPTEVCESIIDMLYSIFFRDTRGDITTLHSCALVCRAWRVRSQRMLFYRVLLSDITCFHRLATILDAAQYLRDYVHEVQLAGYHLYNTGNIFTLFPVVFARKLPNLCAVTIRHLDANESSSPKTPDPPKSRFLPYIPLHPHFPAFLSSFTRVSYLFVQRTTFRSLSEFARMLHGLPNLERLSCDGVRWINPGGSHPDADFTKQPDWMPGRRALPSPPFAPKLRELMVCVTTETIHCSMVLIVFSVLGHGNVWEGKADMDTWTPSDIVDSDDSSVERA